METSITYTSETAFLSTDERRIINRIMRFKDSHPDEIEIISMPENNDGCLYCKIPAKWMRIAPPVKHDLSVEERAERAERLRKSQMIWRSEGSGNENSPAEPQ